MADQDIRLEIDKGIARITLIRSAKMNAMRDETADALLATFTEIEADTAVKAVLITGEGRGFGAGYDLSTIDPKKEPALDEVLDRHFNPLIRAMRGSRLPIVAAVNGACAGASVGVALAADIVIAAENAFFYEPFVGIALVPDAGNTLFLTRMAGRIRASGAMLLGERITAREAERWGLVWRVVPPEDLMDEAAKTCATLAARSAHAVAVTKRLIARAAEVDLDTMLDLERDHQGEAGRSPEMRAAIARFFASGK